VARQMAFALPLRSASGREDFFISPANALALSTLDAPETWPQGRMLLIGPEGCGKTHLAQLWADERGACIISGAALAPQLVPALAAAAAVVVENAETLAGDPAAEAALFHLHNLIAAEGGLLLLTAGRSPRDWGLTLPDLVSRIAAFATVRIAPPDDALLAAVLVKLFADRQLAVAPSLITWLVPRIDRSLATARRVVAALDARALAEGGAVSRALAARVLDSAP